MSFKRLAVATAALSAGLLGAAPAQAGQDAYIGEIIAFPYDFCPRNTLPANGQSLAIASNTALFSLLGTTYGGNGSTTFALPDLRGRTAISQGSSTLSNVTQGEVGGSETFTVSAATMPAHKHTGALRAVSAAGNTTDPADNSLAMAPAGLTMYSTTDPTNNMNAGDVVIGPAGSGTPVSLTSPALTMTWCIVSQGLFPSRN